MATRLHHQAQHFLSGPLLVAELVGHSNLRSTDLVYDLGAGSGVISAVLAERCGQVVAVELEPVALDKLRYNMATRENVKVIAGDMLTVPLPDRPYKIFSNIPFSLSAATVRRLTEVQYPPQAIYLIVQKQFARKLVPGSDHFTSELSSQLAPLFTARIRRPLKRTDFTPPPGVDTVLLELLLRDEPLLPRAAMPAYRDFVSLCYSRQKFYRELPLGRAGISAELRPSQLESEQWLRLFTVCRKL